MSQRLIVDRRCNIGNVEYLAAPRDIAEFNRAKRNQDCDSSTRHSDRSRPQMPHAAHGRHLLPVHPARSRPCSRTQCFRNVFNTRCRVSSVSTRRSACPAIR